MLSPVYFHLLVGPYCTLLNLLITNQVVPILAYIIDCHFSQFLKIVQRKLTTTLKLRIEHNIL